MNLKVVKGDITKFKGDVIVNAANTSLTGTGGLSAAIFRAAGPELAEECDKVCVNCLTNVKCSEGSIHVTNGYALLAKEIIHAVGPRWRGGNTGEETVLRKLYESIMAHASNMCYKTMAVPSLSTGHHGFPIKRAATIAVYTIGRMLHFMPNLVVTIYTYSDADFRVYSEILSNAKCYFAEMPDWVVHIYGPFAGEGRPTRRDMVVYECRNAGKVGTFSSEYYQDCFPYFTIRTKIAGTVFEAGHRHSYLAWSGGISADAGIVERYVTSAMSYPVWLNGRPWREMTGKEISDLAANSKREFWVTDPRFLYAAYAALCENKADIAAVLSCSPSRYAAAEVLDRYRLRMVPPNFGVHFPKMLDCYPWFGCIQKDMLKYGKGFVEHVVSN